MTIKQTDGVKIDFDLDNASFFLKLLIILYADDTVIFSESAEDLQNALPKFAEYCNSLKLKRIRQKLKLSFSVKVNRKDQIYVS